MNTLLLTLLLAILPPCPAEDSTNCGWNATTHGNGYGNSFVAFGTEERWFTIAFAH